jgi:hypothetical protein
MQWTVHKCTRGEVYNELCDVTSKGAGHLLLQPASQNRLSSDLSDQGYSAKYRVIACPSVVRPKMGYGFEV